MKKSRRPNFKKLLPAARRMTRPDGTRYWLVAGKEFVSLAEAYAHFHSPSTQLAQTIKGMVASQKNINPKVDENVQPDPDHQN
jgi:hypothetical protein